MARQDSPGPIGGPSSYGMSKENFDKTIGKDRDRGSDRDAKKRQKADDDSKPSPSLFDKAIDFLTPDDEMDEDEEQELVNDWYSVMTTPEDVLQDIAVNQAQQLQTSYALGGLPIPGLEGKVLKAGVPRAIGALGDIPEEFADTEEAVGRMLERQYDEEAGIGGDIASAVKMAGPFAGPLGNIAAFGAGGYQAAQVPGALGRLSNQLGIDASLPSGQQRPLQPRDSDSQVSTVDRGFRDYSTPQLPMIDPYAELGLEAPDFNRIWGQRSLQSLL